MDTQSKTYDFICLLCIALSYLRATFAMPSTGRSILMNGTVNFSVMDSWKSILLSLLWCSSFTVHLWLEGGHPKEKAGYLHINVSALVTFQLCFTLGKFLSVFVNKTFLTQLFGAIDREMSN
jgi:hypothetical protein